MQPKLPFHLPANFLRLQPVMPRPDRSAADKADAVPDDVKMLPPVLNVFNDHPLMVEHFVTVFLLTAFHDGQNLLVGQVFAFHRVDADMMQRLGAVGATGDLPHILKPW